MAIVRPTVAEEPDFAVCTTRAGLGLTTHLDHAVEQWGNASALLLQPPTCEQRSAIASDDARRADGYAT
jgi:hypothetical protein